MTLQADWLKSAVIARSSAVPSDERSMVVTLPYHLRDSRSVAPTH